MDRRMAGAACAGCAGLAYRSAWPDAGRRIVTSRKEEVEGLYKLCEHKGRARDRCEHAWWARFRRVRVSLEKWSNREITSKTEADAVFDDLRKTIRAGTFDRRGVEPPREISPQTFRQFAEVYKERHVLAKGLPKRWYSATRPARLSAGS